MCEHDEVINQLLARQRAYTMHDPECPAKTREDQQKKTDVYLPPESFPCNCWLSEDKEPHA